MTTLPTRAVERSSPEGHAFSLIGQTDQSIASSIRDARALIAELGAERPLLVLDREAIAASGVGERIDALRKISVGEFDAFTPNPTCEDAAAAAAVASRSGADSIVGIGGGSCLDVAKIAALAARHPGIAASLSRGEQTERARPLPIIAVPTTSGTGSEATSFAAIYVNGSKVSVVHDDLRPRGVVLDPSLHLSMPPGIAAVTGLDALGQALESLWAVGSTRESRDLASRAGRLVASHLEESVREGTLEARTGMMLGAHLAGRAINISRTTASHALSYQLTMRFGLPHGHAVALTLGHLAAVNVRVDASNCADARGVDHVVGQTEHAASLLGSAPAELPARIADLLGRLGLARDLRSAGVPHEDVQRLAAEADPVRLGNNPRALATEDIAELLDSAWSNEPA